VTLTEGFLVLGAGGCGVMDIPALTLPCMLSSYYLSHCYSIAMDRLYNNLCLSVSLSVNTPTAAILIRF